MLHDKNIEQYTSTLILSIKAKDHVKLIRNLTFSLYKTYYTRATTKVVTTTITSILL